MFKRLFISLVLLAIFLLSVEAEFLTVPLNREFFLTGAQDPRNAGFFCNFTAEEKRSLGIQISTYLCLKFTGSGDVGFIVYTDLLNDTWSLYSVGNTWKNEITVYGEDKQALPNYLTGKQPLLNGTLMVYNMTSVGYLRVREVANYNNLIFIQIIIEEEDSSMTQAEKNYRLFLSWLTIILLWISIGGAFLTILTFTVHTELRTPPIRLIMFLCVCVVISNFFFIMSFEPGFVQNDAVCFLTGMAVHGFFLANFCWTFCIAINFYQMIVNRNRESESLEKWYHLGGWGFPLFCVMWVAVFFKYGNRSGACFVTNSIFHLIFFFIPGLLVIASNFILFFFVAREIHETLAAAPKSGESKPLVGWKEFRVYLSILVSIGFQWIFGFIMVLFTYAPIRLLFLTIFTVFAGLQGFLIFVFYCCNLKVLGKWAGLFGNCLPFCRRFESLESRRTTSSGRTASSRISNSRNSDASGDASADADD